jgi:hypothetical protein
VVRDISRGGINLLAPQPLEAGQLLSIELPAPAGTPTATVLACVVHATCQPDDRWALGCAFAAELGDDDLKPFAARRLRATPPDQRAWVRFPCAVRASFRVLLDEVPRHRPAEVVDISTRGIGLRVGEPLAVGTVLRLEVEGIEEPARLALLACVVRATAQPDGGWVLGCTFQRELGDAEIQCLLS